MEEKPERKRKRKVEFVDPAAASGAVGDAAAAQSIPLTMTETLGELIDCIVSTENMISSITAYRAQLIDEARRLAEMTEHATRPGQVGGWDAAMTARRVIVTELACALRLPERSAERLVEESRSLLHELPGTHQALREGAVSYRHAQTVIDHANSLPEEARQPFEEAILPDAKKLTVAKLDRKARQAREHVHPESIAVRRERSVADRQVLVEPARDGMAWLTAFLPAEQALAIRDRLDQVARGLRAQDETRTLTQLRVDVFADLLLSAHTCDGDTCDGLGHGITGRVFVTVPVLTLLGTEETPASLDGYGPIDPDTARKLAGHAPSFTRILTHPETGAVLSVGRDSYKVPKDLRNWLQVRDETCRFPGCNRLAINCDLDHSLDWQHDGESRHDNLAHACEGHHQLKHHTRWAVEHTGDGQLTWTSPSGHEYTTQPAVSMGPTVSTSSTTGETAPKNDVSTRPTVEG